MIKLEYQCFGALSIRRDYIDDVQPNPGKSEVEIFKMAASKLAMIEDDDQSTTYVIIDATSAFTTGKLREVNQ